jgi:hypothetical protein
MFLDHEFNMLLLIHIFLEEVFVLERLMVQTLSEILPQLVHNLS